MLKNFIQFSGIFVLIIVSSCKDDEPGLNRDALIAQPWNLTELKYTIAQGFTIDGFEQLEECNKDNRFVFNDDGELQVLEHTLICQDSPGEILATGTWSLESSILNISSDYFSRLIEAMAQSFPGNFEYDNNTFGFEVTQLTTSTLKLLYKEQYSDPSTGLTYDIDINLTFQAISN